MGPIGSWHYFKTVQAIPLLNLASTPDWRVAAAEIATDVYCFRISSDAKIDLGHLHSAIVLAWHVEEVYQALIYTPHGIHSYSSSLSALLSVRPEIHPHALLHGRDEVTNPWYLGGRVNLGLKNGLEVAEKLGPTLKYWIATHDEDKEAGGFVRRVLQRKKHSFTELEDCPNDAEVEKGPERIDLASGETIELV